MDTAKIYVIVVLLFTSSSVNVATAQELPQTSTNFGENTSLLTVPHLRVVSNRVVSNSELDDSNNQQAPLDSDTTSSNQQEQSDTIGEEPPEDISRLFLRESEILLKPMEVQLTTGFEYRKNDTFENLRLIRARDVSVPLSVSLGLTERFELFASIPLLYSQKEFVAFNDSDKTDDDGYGDLSFGFSFKLRNETQSFPSITGSLSQSSPTGSEADPDDPRSVEFTSGFWSQRVGLSMTKSVDPAVLFVNVGYSHVYEKQEDNDRVKPGDSFNYGFGAGFSINSAISLSGRLLGSYSKDYQVNGSAIVGSGGEAVSFDISLTYGLSNKTRMETSIDFGLNDDASDLVIGFSYIYSLRKPGS